MMKKFLTGMILMLCAFGARADLYLADPVSVQGDGDNPVLAKQSALEQGQRQSYAQLMRRLMGKDLFSAELPIADIVNQVQDISIQNEKNTAQSYWATVRVRFQPEAVQNFLNAHHQSYLKNDPPTYLVVPVVMSGTQMVGLEDDNVFYQMLKNQDVLSDFYQMKLPVGDVDEMVIVNRALKTGQYADMMGLANRYGATAVLVVFASPKSAENWRLTSVAIPENKAQPASEIDSWYETISLDEAWHQLLNKMEDDWRISDVTGQGQDDTYYARLNEKTLSMWAQDEKAFKKMDFLKDVMLRGVYRNQMLISFSFSGTRSELMENWDKFGWQWQPDMTGPSGTLTRKEVYYE